jgi:L-iditol 2-dehydrogenase
MRTIQITGIRQMACIDVPKPGLGGPHDALLRITAVGVCGSDVHYYETGRIGDQVLRLPHRVGHECAGVVEEVGSAVSRVKAGDRVSVDPAMTCGECDQCRAGREHTCRNIRFLGVPGEADGCFAEYIVMPEECLYPVPKGMSDEAAVLCEPFAIGLYAARRPKTGPDGGAAVLGTGPVGLSVLIGCRLEGAERCYTTDKIDGRCAVAAAHGADWTGNPDRQDVVAEILRREPTGLDVVFECAGRQETLDQAVKLLRPGGTLVLVGISREDRVSFPGHELRRKDLTLINIRRQNRMQGEAVELVGSGKARLDFMVTHRFPLERAAEAFDLVADYRDGVIKAVVTI